MAPLEVVPDQPLAGIEPSARGDRELAIAEPAAEPFGIYTVEHYEIGLYGILCRWATKLGFTDEVIDPLSKNLQEEKEADRKLTEIAERIVIPAAAGTP